MELEHIVPWGRSYDEYIAMFALESPERGGAFLGCGDGPAAFNAVLTALGGHVVSVDPLYRWGRAPIAERIRDTAPMLMRQVEACQDQFEWNQIASPTALRQTRLHSMDIFLADYEAGRRAGRYVTAALPHLPFPTGHFDLVLCSHLLFTYSTHLDFPFHLDALRAMVRVGRELRVFPLVTLLGESSPHLEAARRALASEGMESELCPVPYRFQRGATHMLRVFAPPR